MPSQEARSSREQSESKTGQETRMIEQRDEAECKLGQEGRKIKQKAESEHKAEGTAR